MGYSLNQSSISGHPPLMVFTICLAAFGCTMILLAYLIGEQEVPNPDVPMDWNKLFTKISSYQLCFITNSTRILEDGSNSAEILNPGNATSSRLVDESNSMSAALSNVVDSATVDPFKDSNFVEISVKAQFMVKEKYPSESPFAVKGNLKGKLLGLTGKYAQILYNLSMSFHRIDNSSCTDICHSTYDVCISMNFPSNLLPKTKFPDKCSSEKFTIPDRKQIFFFESLLLEKNCLTLDYTPDVQLTEMLTPHDRSIVNLHLMHTSYFMFVMVMTLVCYSLIRNRFRQPQNYVSLHKNPLNA